MMPKEPCEILTRCFGAPKFGAWPRSQVLSFAAVSTQPCAVAFTKSVREIKKADLAMLSFEALCVRARINPVELLGAILMAAKSMKAQESALKAILAHPDVVQATIKAATDEVPIIATRNGEREVVGHANGDIAAQRIMHEAVGFLPTKKGGGVEINFGFGRPPEDRDEDTDADEDWDDAFPALGENIQEWSADKHKLLEGGK